MIRIVIFLLIFPAGVNAAQNGQALYEKHCSICHGVEGKGGVGVPLALPSFINGVSDEYLMNTVHLGRSGRLMPAFPELNEMQIQAIIDYMRSWLKEPVVKHDGLQINNNGKT